MKDWVGSLDPEITAAEDISPGMRVLVIAPTAASAEVTLLRMRYRAAARGVVTKGKDFRCARPGDTVCGWGADLIVIVGDWSGAITDRVTSWFHEAILTRLEPHGHVVAEPSARVLHPELSYKRNNPHRRILNPLS